MVFLLLLQFLSVKIVIPERIQNDIYQIIQKKYFTNAYNPEYKILLSAALNDAYTKKCELFSILVHLLAILSQRLIHFFLVRLQ